MSILSVILIIVGMGAVGGLLNCLMTGEFKLPQYDSGVWRPGWVGNLIIGGVAAFIVVGFNGPFALLNLLSTQNPPLDLTIGQLANSILVGTGGGNIITSLAQKKAERSAKDLLASALQYEISKRPAP